MGGGGYWGEMAEPGDSAARRDANSKRIPGARSRSSLSSNDRVTQSESRSHEGWNTSRSEPLPSVLMVSDLDQDDPG